MAMREVASVECTSDSSDDEEFAPVTTANPVSVKLPNGDIHVCCVGRRCEFLICNEDRLLVCKYTGIEHGSECIDEFFDLCGGIGKKCGDPDANCGETVFGKYTKRIDPVIASKRAWQEADKIGEDDIGAFVNPDDASAVTTQKRGALCVGESVNTSSNKRPRSSKKNVSSRATCTNLMLEAQNVYKKLIDFEKCKNFSSKGEGSRDRRRERQNSKLQDEGVVRAAAIKRYVKLCLATWTAPTLSTIHDICLHAQQVALDARRAATPNDDSSTLRTIKFRTSIASFIVTLWTSVCASPYMLNQPKRGTDGFRPFVAGVLYTTKRGLCLYDGTVLVPRCDILASALPALRGAGNNTIAKTLHSSSHRGVCTLSRCLSSVPQEEQKRLFASAIESAARFNSHVFSSCDC